MPWTWDDDEQQVDPTDWRVWWEFNKDRWLNRRTRIHRMVTTGSDDFDLGRGSRQDRSGSVEGSLQRHAVPAFYAAIEKGGSNEFVTSSLLALTKLDEPASHRGRLEFILEWFLKNGNDPIRRSTILAYGLRVEQPFDSLNALLFDTPEGRELVGTKEVDGKLRSFAAFALGLYGQRSGDQDERSRVIAALNEMMVSRDPAHEEPRVAAATAIALVPLDEMYSVPGCDCGGVFHEMQTSREAQIAHLLWYFEGEGRQPDIIRAHVPRALAQLTRGTPDVFETRVAKALLKALEPSQKESRAVQQSAVLALGELGDADRDEIDARIRSSLTYQAKHGEPQVRRFALIALAEIAARPGEDEATAFEGTNDIRRFLVKQLARGRRSVRPWAALALGLLGRELQDQGLERDDAADRALAMALRGAKDDDDFGAYALACGLRESESTLAALREKLEKLNGDSARGFAALGLGLAGDDESREAVATVFAEGETPEVLMPSAIALGLLADSQSSLSLVAEFDAAAELPERRAALAAALGFVGDGETVQRLSALLNAPEATDDERRMAALSLGNLADRRPRTWSAEFSAGMNYRAAFRSLTNEEGWGVLDVR